MRHLGLDGLHKWLFIRATGVGLVLRLAPHGQLGGRCFLRERLLLPLACDLVDCCTFLEEHVFVSRRVYGAVTLLALLRIRAGIDLIVWCASLSLILEVLALSFGYSCHLYSKLILARYGDRFDLFWGGFLALLCHHCHHPSSSL